MEHTDAFPGVRIATADDLGGIVRTLMSAFSHDPLWGPAFPDAAHRASQMAALWRLLSGSALRFPWTFVTGNVESVAVWLPPGADELTAEESDGFEEFLLGLVGEAATHDIEAVMAQFEASRPSEPHFYLSLLGTHDEHRGRGLGMTLLRENLARVDALAQPSYLESTNPANNARYESVGFERHGAFTTASGHIVTTMWRAAR
jgi:GNAT superfamily N-acetyltransferase